MWKYSRDSNECLAGYSDADWTECVDNRKSTSGGCFYLGNNLMSWMSKKQNLASLSTTEIEYIAVGSCYAQLLWMKKLLHYYGITQDTMCVFCDNTSVINLLKNPVQHLKSKAYQDLVPLHSRIGGEDYVFRIYKHWQPKSKHIYQTSWWSTIWVSA